MDDVELIVAFHTLWDNFPGLARLIDDKHNVLAANPTAVAKGFAPGVKCASVGDSSIHRKCKLNKMFGDGEAHTDTELGDRIRGWFPVKGRNDVCVHFALLFPEEQ